MHTKPFLLLMLIVLVSIFIPLIVYLNREPTEEIKVPTIEIECAPEIETNTPKISPAKKEPLRKSIKTFSFNKNIQKYLPKDGNIEHTFIEEKYAFIIVKSKGLPVGKNEFIYVFFTQGEDEIILEEVSQKILKYYSKRGLKLELPKIQITHQKIHKYEGYKIVFTVLSIEYSFIDNSI